MALFTVLGFWVKSEMVITIAQDVKGCWFESSLTLIGSYSHITDMKNTVIVKQINSDEEVHVAWLKE